MVIKTDIQSTKYQLYTRLDIEQLFLQRLCLRVERVLLIWKKSVSGTWNKITEGYDGK